MSPRPSLPKPYILHRSYTGIRSDATKHRQVFPACPPARLLQILTYCVPGIVYLVYIVHTPFFFLGTRFNCVSLPHEHVEHATAVLAVPLFLAHTAKYDSDGHSDCLCPTLMWTEPLFTPPAPVGWLCGPLALQLSAARFFKGVLPLLEDVAVVSARSLFEAQFPGSPLCWKVMNLLMLPLQRRYTYNVEYITPGYVICLRSICSWLLALYMQAYRHETCTLKAKTKGVLFCMGGGGCS